MTTAAEGVTTAAEGGRGRARRWTAAVLAGTAGLLLAVGVGVRHTVDAGTAERRLEDLLSGPGRWAEVEVGDVEARILGRAARLGDVSVRVGPVGSDGASLELEVAAAEFEGVSLSSLVFGRGLRADGLRLERPWLALRPVGSESGGDDARPDATGGERPEGREAPPVISLGRLEAREGRLIVGDTAASEDEGRVAEVRGHVADGLRLTLTEVSVRGDRTGRALSLRVEGDGEARLGRYRGRLRGWRHAVELHEAAVSLDGDSARIDSVRVRPLPDPGAFVRSLEYRTDRVQLAAGPLRARGLDVRRLVRGGGLRAGRVEIVSPALAVHTDRRLPERPGEGPPIMPGERLREASVRVRVDTLRVRDGRIEYSERTEAAERSGRLSFEEIDATVLHLTNDPGRAGAVGPAVARVSARIFGAARMRAEFEVPVLSPELDFTFAGQVGEMDLRSLNDMLEPVEGLRVEDGRLEHLSFDARVQSGRARGTVRARYRGLSVVKVDPETGDQSLSDVVESVLLDAEIESANPRAEDREPRTGRIDHRRAPDDPFFQFLWESLRSGLLSLAGA